MKPRRRHLLVAASVALVLVFAASGCTVATRVAVYETAPGSGTLAVSVDFDQATVAALGGEATLARELDVSDLRAAGWQVSGLTPVSSGHEVVTATHTFSTEAELSALAASLAGSGPVAGRPFRLDLTTSRSFWHTVYRLSGTVDLRCGLACFGDEALQKATGSVVGVPVPAGSTPDLQFEVTARLPGKPGPGGAGAAPDGLVTWQAPLGQLTTLSAESSRWNSSNVEEVVAGAGGLVLILLVLLVWLVWRRLRRRRSRRRSGGDGAPPAPPAEPDRSRGRRRRRADRRGSHFQRG